jgi:hypothetical protein
MVRYAFVTLLALLALAPSAGAAPKPMEGTARGPVPFVERP